MTASHTLSTGLFVGSFDPFTIGHDNIVRRALPLFDRLVIGVGNNHEKKYMLTAQQRTDAINALYCNEPQIEVVTFEDFAIDLAQRIGARYIVKGVRSVKDFEYERDQAELNRRLANIETILLYADPALTAISSSAAREFMYFHKDASWMLPTPPEPQP